MIDIQLKDTLSHNIVEFLKREWHIAEIEYFGKTLDWGKGKIYIEAFEKKEPVGILECSIQAGVLHIKSIIVKQTRRKQGIGELLMKEAEKIAREKKAHKLFLQTGKTWSTNSFYQKLGYIKTGELPNHFAHKDYVEYSKFIK